MSGYGNMPGSNDAWRQTSNFAPNSYGGYGQPPFGPPPNNSFNFKIPLILGGVFSLLIFMLIAGLFVVGAVRRGMREFEHAQLQAKARADFERMEAERKAREQQQRLEFDKRMQEIRDQDQERMARMRAEQQARIESMRSSISSTPTPPPFFPPPTFRPGPSFTPPSSDPPAHAPNPTFSPAPPPFASSRPSFLPPVNSTPAPAADSGPGTQTAEAPPGFPATAMTQFKPKDIVFVQAQDGKWYPALVQVKRGVLTQVRFSTNGFVEVVSIDRIRLEKEPEEKVASNAPSALRAVDSASPTKKVGDEEEEPLFAAKPGRDSIPTSTPTSTPVNASSAAEFTAPSGNSSVREWTDASGTYKVQAELVSFEFDHVQLKRTDGKILNMPLTKLSADDQQFVREKFP